MSAMGHGSRRVLPLLLLLTTLPAALPAQIVQLKTVPVATGDQFLLFPSQNLGMGGVSLAVDDPLLDPFVNPAKGGRLEGGQLFGAPVFYGISDEDGAGRTLPVGALFGSSRWFGGGTVALQQLVLGNRNGAGWGTPDRLSERSALNTYAHALLGLTLPGGRTRLAASASWAGLDAVDGVELLYARARDIDQDGRTADFRLGLLHEWEDERAVELLLLHNRFDMTHDVTYMEWIWDAVTRTSRTETRVETNRDRTNTWGVHLGYQQPLAETGWRIGGIVTGNRKEHPKIPNYEIMNIPRDPGYSWGYNVGVGLSTTEGPATVGIDVIWEPIRSDTWADAAEPVETASGGTIPAGGRTIENEFRFSNALVRLGLKRELERYGFQLGLQMRAIHYDLEQHDNVQETRRNQTESWMEWTPSWGASLKFPEFQVRYAGRLTSGTGRPGVGSAGFFRAGATLANASDFIIAPSGALTLQDARVLTHQVSVSLPLRGRAEPVAVKAAAEGGAR